MIRLIVLLMLVGNLAAHAQSSSTSQDSPWYLPAFPDGYISSLSCVYEAQKPLCQYDVTYATSVSEEQYMQLACDQQTDFPVAVNTTACAFNQSSLLSPAEILALLQAQATPAQKNTKNCDAYCSKVFPNNKLVCMALCLKASNAGKKGCAALAQACGDWIKVGNETNARVCLQMYEQICKKKKAI